MKITINNHTHESKKAVLLIDDKIMFGEDTTFSDAMSLLMSASLHAMKKTAEQYPDLKEDIYDEFNHSASKILEEFIPDHELRPDLTAEAIKKYENEILEMS
jgi:hypothetical protein